MRIPGRTIFRLCVGIVAGINLTVFDSLAQNYPVKPIRIVVAFSPGGITDVLARQVAQKLVEPLGQPVVIENRPGGSTAIANERVATSPPDGYTLLMVGPPRPFCRRCAPSFRMTWSEISHRYR